ncbi:MAG: hypothetical protein AB1441_08245 [Bacillota bacterium]
MPKVNTARRVPVYRGEPYWERERPEVVETGRLILSYFKEAGKLQISQAYKDPQTGELKRGKTVTLDQEDLALHPEARGLLQAALDAWSE